MKRSKSINLERMRKCATRKIEPQGSLPNSAPLNYAQFIPSPLKSLVLGAAAFSLMGCSDSQEAAIYASPEHCANENPSLAEECQTAYQQALAESANAGPKYRSMYDCAAEFGERNCVPYRSEGGSSWFMPAVAGFALGRALDGGRYYGSPLYTSSYYGSNFYGRWSTVDGRLYKKRYGRMNMRADTFKPKPAVKRTISRGGFGSTVAAKSRWSGSSSRGGWGG